MAEKNLITIYENNPHFKHGFSKEKLVELVEKLEKKGCVLIKPERSKLGTPLGIKPNYSIDDVYPSRTGSGFEYAVLDCPIGI